MLWNNRVESMRRLWEEMDNWFEEFNLGRFATPRGAAFPPMNLWQDDESLFVEAELPGVSRDDFELTVVGDHLSIRGERKSAAEGERELRRECPRGEFARAIKLPVAVDGEHVEAKLTDGVLLIKLPKAAEARPRRIDVASAS